MHLLAHEILRQLLIGRHTRGGGSPERTVAPAIGVVERGLSWLFTTGNVPVGASGGASAAASGSGSDFYQLIIVVAAHLHDEAQCYLYRHLGERCERVATRGGLSGLSVLAAISAALSIHGGDSYGVLGFAGSAIFVRSFRADSAVGALLDLRAVCFVLAIATERRVAMIIQIQIQIQITIQMTSMLAGSMGMDAMRVAVAYYSLTALRHSRTA